MITKITIDRAEGPTHECETTHTFTSFKDANKHLRSMSYSAPEELGYDKIDFYVRFEDEGKEHDYKGRYDMTRHLERNPDKGYDDHAVAYLEWLKEYDHSFYEDNKEEIELFISLFKRSK